MTSGYSLAQTRKIVIRGIKGYEAKLKRCKGARIHRTASESGGSRTRKKLIGKSSWFKGGKKRLENSDSGSCQNVNVGPGGNNTTTPGLELDSGLKTRTVLFVDQTPGGVLAARLKTLYLGLENTMGFKIKVVERTGRTLRSSFPLSTLWDGLECGRDKCIPCKQGAEDIQPCTRQNLVYENICSECNPLVLNKGALKDYNADKPSLYVGESSRSLAERIGEHWTSFKSNTEGSHIRKLSLIHI